MFFQFTFCDCHWLIPWLLPFLLGLIFGMRYLSSYKSRISELEANRSKNSNRIIALEEDLNISQGKLHVGQEDLEKSRQRLTQIEAELALAKGKLYEVEEAEALAKQTPPKTAFKSTNPIAATAVGLAASTDSISNTLASNTPEPSLDKLPEVKSFKEIQEEESKLASPLSKDSDDIAKTSESVDVQQLPVEEEGAMIERSIDQTLSDQDAQIDSIKEQTGVEKTGSAITKTADDMVKPSDGSSQTTVRTSKTYDASVDQTKSIEGATESASSKEGSAIQEKNVTQSNQSIQKEKQPAGQSFADAQSLASAAAVVGIGSSAVGSEKTVGADIKQEKKKKHKSEKKKKSKDQKKKGTKLTTQSTVAKSKKKKKKIDSGFRQATSGRFQKLKENDLTAIEGIGPKTAKLLQENGISSWAQLSTKTPSELKDILAAAGSRYSHLDPSTWTRQANLAAGNHWTRLEKLQDKLDGGKDTSTQSGKKTKSKQSVKGKKAKQKLKSSKTKPKAKKNKKTSVGRVTQSIQVGSAIKKSNLEIIEGIGPKMNALLNKEGIKSWNDLASHSPGEIRSILDKHGDRYRIIDVKLWPKQATYAAKGQWSKLIDFQKKDGSASKAEKVLTKAGVFRSNKIDDLKLIEGIGPKTEKVLNKAGIKNWKTLSKTSSVALTAIMSKAGKRFAFADTSSWPKQAELAAAGKFDQLEKLQQKL